MDLNSLRNAIIMAQMPQQQGLGSREGIPLDPDEDIQTMLARQAKVIQMFGSGDIPVGTNPTRLKHPQTGEWYDLGKDGNWKLSPIQK